MRTARVGTLRSSGVPILVARGSFPRSPPPRASGSAQPIARQAANDSAANGRHGRPRHERPDGREHDEAHGALAGATADARRHRRATEGRDGAQTRDRQVSGHRRRRRRRLQDVPAEREESARLSLHEQRARVRRRCSASIATKPTSILYKRGDDGKLHLVGAMYTMPKNAKLDSPRRRAFRSASRAGTST